MRRKGWGLPLLKSASRCGCSSWILRRSVFVNPEITEESDEEVLMNEGCLSLPGLHEDVYRPEKIRIRYFDERFQEHEEVLEGWPARAVQHEYDHIEGIVFTDRLAPLRKTLVRNKLNAIAPEGPYGIPAVG